MPRPARCRTICREPLCTKFMPETKDISNPIILTVDEYEAIRLVDLENMSHSECAEQMNISRTTVTEIYASARKKIAAGIVKGKSLLIQGGCYKVCSEYNCKKCQGKCKKNKYSYIHTIKKGVNIMRIAVTYDNGNIFGHFGHTEQFKIYDVENGAIINESIIDTNGSGHGALAGLLSDMNIDTLICGGIGGGAQSALAQAGIKLYGGVSGNADEAVKSLIDGTLDFNPDVKCSHHDHEHGDGNHTCGEHGCGGGHCHSN